MNLFICATLTVMVVWAAAEDARVTVQENIGLDILGDTFGLKQPTNHLEIYSLTSSISGNVVMDDLKNQIYWTYEIQEFFQDEQMSETLRKSEDELFVAHDFTRSSDFKEYKALGSEAFVQKLNDYLLAYENEEKAVYLALQFIDENKQKDEIMKEIEILQKRIEDINDKISQKEVTEKGKLITIENNNNIINDRLKSYETYQNYQSSQQKVKELTRRRDCFNTNVSKLFGLGNSENEYDNYVVVTNKQEDERLDPSANLPKTVYLDCAEKEIHAVRLDTNIFYSENLSDIEDLKKKGQKWLKEKLPSYQRAKDEFENPKKYRDYEEREYELKRSKTRTENDLIDSDILPREDKEASRLHFVLRRLTIDHREIERFSHSYPTGYTSYEFISAFANETIPLQEMSKFSSNSDQSSKEVYKFTHVVMGIGRKANLWVYYDSVNQAALLAI